MSWPATAEAMLIITLRLSALLQNTNRAPPGGARVESARSIRMKIALKNREAHVGNPDSHTISM